MLFLHLLPLIPLALGFPSSQPHHKHQKREDAASYLGSLLGTVEVSASFDYVIVGGGTAGLALANRLAADGVTTVAVVEAGTLYEVADYFATAPGADVLGVGSAETVPTVDWGYFTEPQSGAGDRVMSYARGKCLGGSSARNFMIYQRATVDSFDMWAEAVGDDAYTFDNVLPYYEKSPTFTPPNTSKRAANASASYNPSAFSADGGPLSVSYPNYAQPFSSWMEGGMNEIGIETTEDFNSGKLFGAQYCSTTIDPSNENRESSKTSFLDGAIAAGLTNLKIYTLTLGKQIIFDSNKTATGVLVETLGIPYYLNATKEVIICGGAFNSPQMLMVSGIGPAAQLQQFGIDVIKDAPGVGQNMWDHISFGPAYRVEVETLTKLANNPLYLADQFLINYKLLQEGPFANNVADFLAWEKIPAELRSEFSASTLSELSWFPEDWPEVEYLSGAGYVGDWSNLFISQPKDGYQYATILAVLIAPTSRGTVTLQSADTNDLPIIDPGYLTSETDQQVAIAAYKRIRQAFNSTFMSPVVIGDEYYPGPDVQTDEQILETIQNSLQTLWHAACSNKMGNSSDEMAVVDSHTRVFGVNNLRVVDASVFPILVPGHPQSTIYMLAERVADWLMNGD